VRVKVGVSRASLLPCIIFNTRLYTYQPEVHNFKISVVNAILFQHLNQHPMGEEEKSGTSVKQKGRALVKSRDGEPKTTEDGLPSYGAQHHQDALWEGVQQCWVMHEPT